MQYGKTSRSKASPIEWLCQWLQVYSPFVKDKYVFMDQGGEFYSNPDILNVSTNHHYKVHPTGTDSSHQNEPIKRAHRVIGDHVRALLIGANLGIKFWSYAFFSPSPYSKCNGNEWSELLSYLPGNWKEREFFRLPYFWLSNLNPSSFQTHC